MRIGSTILLLSLSSLAQAQRELTAPIKTRSEFPGIRMVYGLVGYAIDLRTNATEA